MSIYGYFLIFAAYIIFGLNAKEWQYPEIHLNYSIDPCEDLYEHVCSIWKHNNPVPSDRTAFSKLARAAEQIKPLMLDLYSRPEPSTSKAINELKQYFRSCNDMEAINALGSTEFRSEIEKIGGWPLLMGSKWNASAFDLTQVLIDISRPRGYRVFIDFSAAQDFRNVSRWLLNFDQRQMVMETREYYLNKKYKSKLDAYREYMTDILWLMIQDDQSNCSREELSNAVNELIAFDIQIAQLTKSKESRYDYDRIYNLRRLSDMNTLVPVINWTRYMIDISPSQLLSYYESDPEIVINELEYMSEINKLLLKTEPRIIANYAFWRLTHVMVITLDSRFQNIQDVFNRRLLGKQKRQVRWKECLIQTIENLDQASGAVYVREKFKPEDFEMATIMVEELRAAYIRTFKANEWVSPEVKKYALKKAKEMVYITGVVKMLYDDKELDNHYKDLSLNQNDSFAKQEDKVLRFENNRRLLNLLKPPGRNDMDISAAMVNAYADQVNNKIVIPAGILQEPFFHRDYPKHAIYAAVGAIIAHEIGHLFDGQGRQFDIRGNLFNWWDNKTLIDFNSRAKCITDQFSKYPLKNADINVNGELTRDENLADLVGLKHTYSAYRNHLTKAEFKEKEWPNFENYTSDQMFFISYANILCTSITNDQALSLALTDAHAPANWRINGAVSNMPQFSKAFNCSKKDTLNNEKRCVIW